MPTSYLFTQLQQWQLYILTWNSYNNPQITVCYAMDNKNVFISVLKLTYRVTAKLFFCILKTDGFIQSEDNKEETYQRVY